MKTYILPPLPPEKQAYAMSRYSRSADSITDSLRFVYGADSEKFFKTYYFDYGHASIADLGHVAVAVEGISDLAAQFILGEDLIDAQCKSTRYQDFSKAGVVDPWEGVLSTQDMATTTRNHVFRTAFDQVVQANFEAYSEVRKRELAALEAQHPRPADMPEDKYYRTLQARAFDVARYCLPMGIPTNFGFVCSIRTLERIIGKLLISPYPEAQQLGHQLQRVCTKAPLNRDWNPDGACRAGDHADALLSDGDPVIPTLGRHVKPYTYLVDVRRRITYGIDEVVDDYDENGLWEGTQHDQIGRVALHRPDFNHAGWFQTEALATMFYQQCATTYGELLAQFGWPHVKSDAKLLKDLVGNPGPHDPPLFEFRMGLPFQFEIDLDYGAFRDLWRHRRCTKIWKDLFIENRCQTPPNPADPESAQLIERAHDRAVSTALGLAEVDATAAKYILPFSHRVSFLLKMDFSEAQYITKLRSGVKGNDAYRWVAWTMAELLANAEPDMQPYVEATSPDVREPLIR